MREKLLFLGVLLVMVLSVGSTSCGGTSSGSAPDPLAIKSQDNVYTEPSPARIQLHDAAGNPIKAWFDLHYVTVVNRGGCNPACLDFSVDLGTDPQSNPYVVVTFECGFSEDGISFVYVTNTPITSCGGALTPDQSTNVQRTLSIPGNPAYFLVKASYQPDIKDGVVTRPGGDGFAFIKFR